METQKWRETNSQRHKVESAGASPHCQQDPTPSADPASRGRMPPQALASLSWDHPPDARSSGLWTRSCPSPSSPPRATANLQQQMVLEDALNRFQQEALQGQRVVELSLALLQPQGRWGRQRQLPEQGQRAGGTAHTRQGCRQLGCTRLGRAGEWLVWEWPRAGRSQRQIRERSVTVTAWQGLELDGSGWREVSWHFSLLARPGASHLG